MAEAGECDGFSKRMKTKKLVIGWIRVIGPPRPVISSGRGAG
jgi:hypothetical protein